MFTIERFETEHRGEGVFGPKVGLAAQILTDTGARLNVSRLDGENGWTVDAAFAPNGVPLFVHGFGSRVCIPTVVEDHDLVAALNARAAA